MSNQEMRLLVALSHVRQVVSAVDETDLVPDVTVTHDHVLLSFPAEFGDQDARNAAVDAYAAALGVDPAKNEAAFHRYAARDGNGTVVHTPMEHCPTCGSAVAS